MPYTPVELRHVRVGRALLGYRREAVQNLLAEIADSFETVWRERHQLADQVEAMERELGELRTREHALTQTLIVAEQAATHVKEQAKREAEVILAEAHGEARAVTRNAEGERRRLYAETRRIEALLRAALGMVEEGGSGEPAGWPEQEDDGASDEHVPEDEHLEEPKPQQPHLQKVSGGFGWVDER
jgi:cell division initiation protein